MASNSEIVIDTSDAPSKEFVHSIKDIAIGKYTVLEAEPRHYNGREYYILTVQFLESGEIFKIYSDYILTNHINNLRFYKKFQFRKVLDFNNKYGSRVEIAGTRKIVFN